MIALPDWRAARLQALTAPDGWLNLTDRVEITMIPCTVGSGSDNDLRLTYGPAYLGRLLPGHRFETPDGAVYPFSDHGNPMVQVHPFLLEIHSNDGHPALRVRDLTLPREVSLRYFDVDPAWVIRARWEALASPQPQSIDQKGAAPTVVTLTHRAHFSHQGQDVTLLATHWKSGQPMFVIRDQTSGHQTYAASRFLLGEDMSDNHVTLDFNRAHNPPCAFTDFAICPLPPRQNILLFAVQAGELSLT
ncbi:MAG: DUF1684 domain-containing protein [Candidatus Saccharibacteria bacterium]|nr:DUF1684 domain-containing protein [Pseudorhodobacter sp.]